MARWTGSRNVRLDERSVPPRTRFRPDCSLLSRVICGLWSMENNLLRGLLLQAPSDRTDGDCDEEER